MNDILKTTKEYFEFLHLRFVTWKFHVRFWTNMNSQNEVQITSKSKLADTLLNFTLLGILMIKVTGRINITFEMFLVIYD